jgi:hypothetical protein
MLPLCFFILLSILIVHFMFLSSFMLFEKRGVGLDNLGNCVCTFYSRFLSPPPLWFSLHYTTLNYPLWKNAWCECTFIAHQEQVSPKEHDPIFCYIKRLNPSFIPSWSILHILLLFLPMWRSRLPEISCISLLEDFCVTSVEQDLYRQI